MYHYMRLFILLGLCLPALSQAQLAPLRLYIDADRTVLQAAGHSIEWGVRTALSEVDNQLGNRPVEVVIRDHRGNNKRIAAFVYEGTQYIAERQQRFEMDNEIGFIENTLYNFVFHHQSQLADYAKLTTFVQAAMQPEHHQADLQDIMKSITLFDQHRPLALLDFEGMPIYATTPEAFAQLPAEELAPLLTGAE